ncbi:hypothetical protein GCM10010368_04870 [Streptomyces roseiscleroticus]|uniref:TIR domain-containing protein n=1 Tax=Streptomyces roseiscleroticus TaxID=1972 RepID=A0ABN3DWQ3_9ACTN|nr:TIR-like protein FxsC [Streptomyces ruber]
MVEIFLSYCGEDNDAYLVTDFFGDLCNEIRHTTTLAADDIGYQYMGMRVATEWRKELTDALGSCKVFLAMISPRYFANDFCGKEWWVFAERQRMHIESTPCSESPQFIIPVMWEKCRLEGAAAIPKVASDIWAHDPALGRVYAERGLRQMVQLKKKYHVDYPEFVIALGRRVTELIEASRLPRYEVSENIDSLVNAFLAPNTDRRAPEPTAPYDSDPEPSGPRHVTLTVAASTRKEIGTVRKDTSCYGDQADDWAPYKPDAPDPVVGYAIDVAREMNLLPYPRPFDDEVLELLDTAEAENQLAIIILDPWTTKMESRRKALRDYDRTLSVNVGVVVPRSVADDESRVNAELLHAEVVTLLNRHTKFQMPTFRHSLETVASFKDGVRQVLVELSRLVFSEFTPARGLTGYAFVQRPYLDGPGAE